jgi:hypothetical protein
MNAHSTARAHASFGPVVITLMVHPHPFIEYNGGDDQNLDWTLLDT